MTAAERALLLRQLAMLERIQFCGAMEVDSDLSDDRQASCCPICDGLPPGVYTKDQREQYDLGTEGHTPRACELAHIIAQGRSWRTRQARKRDRR